MKRFLKENKKLVIILACVLAAALAAGAAGYYLKGKNSGKTPPEAGGETSVTETYEEQKDPDFRELVAKFKDIETVSLTSVSKMRWYTGGKLDNEQALEQSFYFKRPDLMLFKNKGSVMYLNGKEIVSYETEAKRYTKEKFTKQYLTSLCEFTQGINTVGLLVGHDFYPRITSVEYLGIENTADCECYTFMLHVKPDVNGDKKINQKVWFDTVSGLMVRNYYRITTQEEPSKKEVECDSVITAFSVNKPIETGIFTFVPKKGDVLYDPAAEAKKLAAELKKLEKAQKEAEAKNPVNKKVQDFALKYYTEETVFTSAAPKPESVLAQAQEEKEKEKPFGLDLKTLDAGGDAPSGEGAPEEPKQQEAADPAPPVPTIQNVAHETTFYSVSAAKNTVVAFWAYPDTKKFLPMFEKIYGENKDKFNFISVCLNIESEEEKVLEDFKNDGLSFPLYFMKAGDIDGVIDKWLIQGIPTVYFIDGRSVMKQYLFGDESVTEKKLAESLKTVF